MAAGRAESSADRVFHEVNELRRHVDRLSLACQAMWELLRDRSGLTEGEIEAKILEIDARDGTVDGKMTVQTIPCPSCHRNTNTKRDICVMCGAPIERKHRFDV